MVMRATPARTTPARRMDRMKCPHTVLALNLQLCARLQEHHHHPIAVVLGSNMKRPKTALALGLQSRARRQEDLDGFGVATISSIPKSPRAVRCQEKLYFLFVADFRSVV